jgi:hypothetical protein
MIDKTEWTNTDYDYENLIKKMGLKMITKEMLNDQNTSYLGDGAYGHVDDAGRVWVITYNGVTVNDQICLEDKVFEALTRLYMNRERYMSEEVRIEP